MAMSDRPDKTEIETGEREMIVRRTFDAPQGRVWRQNGDGHDSVDERIETGSIECSFDQYSIV